MPPKTAHAPDNHRNVSLLIYQKETTKSGEVRKTDPLPARSAARDVAPVVLAIQG